MPAKNAIKAYVEDGYYHIYNRGVEKRAIFKDSQDYKVFLSYLKEYLQPPPKPKPITLTFGQSTFKTIVKPLRNYYRKIDLLAYCLMPNHFHLLVKQTTRNTIELFMRSLATRYSSYFNKRYDRVGSLFQGPYKAVLVEQDDYLLHLSRYIHLNPGKDSPSRTTYSSYTDYLNLTNTSWLNKNTILSYFKTSQKVNFGDALSYQSFVEDYMVDSKEIINDLLID